MRPAHAAAILAAILLIVLLYWKGRTVPTPAAGKRDAGQAGAAPMAQMPHSTVIPASFDTVRLAAFSQLSTPSRRTVTRLQDSLEAMRDSLEMTPIVLRLAQTWQQAKQLPVAAHYSAVVAKLENSPKKLTFAGRFFLQIMPDAPSQPVQLWEAQEAIACLQRAVSLDSTNDTAKIALATAYIEGSGETMTGVQLLLGMVRDHPDGVPANMMLGKLAVQSGQFDKAVGRFETVLKSEPKNTEALYFLAEAYKGKGDNKKAVQLLTRCKELVNRPDFSRDIDQYIQSFK